MISSDKKIQFAVVGGGVIGGGGVARFLLMGFDVKVFDPDPETERKINHVIDNARRSLPGLFEYLLPDEGSLIFCSTIGEAVSDAQWICEAIPERLNLKHKVFIEIQAHCSKDAIIASSTSGFKPSELQAVSSNPKQIIVAHPFNPVYILPAVEIVPGKKTSKKYLNNANKFYK
jgi:carnitine 3-dehydrogenase